MKFCPPLIDVESDYSDDGEWLRAMQSKLTGTKEKKIDPSAKPWEEFAAEITLANRGNAPVPVQPVAGVTVHDAMRGYNPVMPELQGMWTDLRQSLHLRQ